MQPIPYEAIPGSDTTSIILKLTIGLLIGAAGAVFILASKKKEELEPSRHGKKRAELNGYIGLAAVIMGLVLISTGFGPLLRSGPEYSQVYHQTESVQKEIQKSYGLDLSFKDAEALEYPSEGPKAKFRVYGSFEEQRQTEGKAFVSRTVYLVWSDGSLGLSESSDGKSFSPLEPKN